MLCYASLVNKLHLHDTFIHGIERKIYFGNDAYWISELFLMPWYMTLNKWHVMNICSVICSVNIVLMHANSKCHGEDTGKDAASSFYYFLLFSVENQQGKIDVDSQDFISTEQPTGGPSGWPCRSYVNDIFHREITDSRSMTKQVGSNIAKNHSSSRWQSYLVILCPKAYVEQK